MNAIKAGIITAALGTAASAVTYLDDTVAEGCDQPSVSYHEFRKQVRTGDLILCSSTLITSFTRIWTQSLWSHVGMAYFDDNDTLYEWSSHNKTESITNSMNIVRGGPQLVAMERLAAESGTVFWQPVTLNDEQRARISNVVRLLAYRLKFSSNVEMLTYAGGPFARWFAGYGGGMACPHVVAATYGAIGALELDRDLATYTPEMLSETGDAKWLVPTGTTKMVVGYDSTSLINLPKKISIHTC